MKSQRTLKMGSVRSNTRSIGQFLYKLCVKSRSHIVSLTLMKLGENVWLDEISKKFGNGSSEKLGHYVKSCINLVYVLEVTFSV